MLLCDLLRLPGFIKARYIEEHLTLKTPVINLYTKYTVYNVQHSSFKQ